MVQPIPLIAAGIGFMAQPSVFAADPTPSPSPPAKAAVVKSASPDPLFEINPNRISNRKNPNQ